MKTTLWTVLLGLSLGYIMHAFVEYHKAKKEWMAELVKRIEQEQSELVDSAVIKHCFPMIEDSTAFISMPTIVGQLKEINGKLTKLSEDVNRLIEMREDQTVCDQPEGTDCNFKLDKNGRMKSDDQ